MAANGRIEKGQPVSAAISASAWNRAQDAADIVLGSVPGMRGGALGSYAGASNIVLVRNDSGADVKASGILGISGIANAPPDATNEIPEISRAPVFTGVAPTNPSHETKILVALEPIASGAIGRAACGGVVTFRLESVSSSHLFAAIKDGVTLNAVSSGIGSIRILARTTVGQGVWVWAVGEIATLRTHRLCKTSAAFSKGTTATLNVWESGLAGSETQTTGVQVAGVVNKYANISSGKFVSIAIHGNGTWYVVAAEC